MAEVLFPQLKDNEPRAEERKNIKQFINSNWSTALDKKKKQKNKKTNRGKTVQKTITTLLYQRTISDFPGSLSDDNNW